MMADLEFRKYDFLFECSCCEELYPSYLMDENDLFCCAVCSYIFEPEPLEPIYSSGV